MRIQILPLPSVVVGDDVQEPFALIVDEYDAPTTDEEFNGWKQFRQECGARAVLVTPETVEVVDRYAESADGFADREVARLQDYLTTQFPLPKGVPGPDDTPVDVAINLLSLELIRKEVVALKERMDRVGSGQISWSLGAMAGTPVTNSGQDIAEPAPPTHTGEPVEIASLPPEVISLTHAVERLRDEWTEADVHTRYTLWMAVHDASDAVYKGPYRETPTVKRAPDFTTPDGRAAWL